MPDQKANAIQAGVALVDITPDDGLAMSGFAARVAPATGMHDPLTVRAVVVNDTAIVCADVIGLHEESCRRIRERSPLPNSNVIVSALHTHGGPDTMPGRLGGGCDARYLSRLEDACVEAIETACANRCSARILSGSGTDPNVAKNRRHPGGIVDPNLPVLGIRKEGGEWIAVIASYACHPVVLGADNTLWTADYPGIVRRELEAAYPGALGIFLSGCAGDANTGHTASASFNAAPSATRTFEEAERIGKRVAACARQANLEEISNTTIRNISGEIHLDFERREQATSQELAKEWEQEAAADPSRAALLNTWIAWAKTVADRSLNPWRARVVVFNWGGVPIIALPGEIFAETALAIRKEVAADDAFVICFSNGCPGYISPESEYQHGGYEVDEAHRYYGMPASFAPGSAERLLTLASSLHKQIDIAK